MEIIYKKNDIEIRISTECSTEFVSFAEDTLWGTKGIQYKMTELKKELESFKNPMFVYLYDGDFLSAICLLNKKIVTQNDSKINVFYSCLWSVHPTKMNKGLCPMMVNATTEYLFEKYDKLVIYAYVEDDNDRSKRVVDKTQYQFVTNFTAPCNVQFNPKINPQVQKLKKSEVPEILALLKIQYKDHSFVDIEESFDSHSYYVLRENNIVNAGVQIKKLRWKFIGLSGLEGFLMMNVIPYLPGLKKIFNPKDHLFLKAGNIYIGVNGLLGSLIGSVMQQEKLHTCIAYTNQNSKIDAQILKEFENGVLSSNDAKVSMYCRSQNVLLSEIEMPQFLSLTDSI